MGILKRFKDIMSSNINALLDKAEDPEKMIDQYLRDLQEDLRKVKSETATVMAEEQRCKRQLDECSIAESIEKTVVDNLYVIPSNVNLAGAEIELLGINDKEYILKLSLIHI